MHSQETLHYSERQPIVVIAHRPCRIEGSADLAHDAEMGDGLAAYTLVWVESAAPQHRAVARDSGRRRAIVVRLCLRLSASFCRHYGVSIRIPPRLTP